MAAGGGVVSATVSSGTYKLLNVPPPFVGPGDLTALRLFEAMSGNRGFSVAITEPFDAIGGFFYAPSSTPAVLAGPKPGPT